MISRIRGTLERVADGHALVQNQGLFYEIMLPSALLERLKDSDSIGQEMTFETIYYIEAGDKKASHLPKLVGFTDPLDREFFSLMTQVNGMGVKKALRCLTMPIRDVATAIENRNADRLSHLPGVGARLAEKIIAELHGKTAKFALAKESEPLASVKPPKTQFESDAIDVLMQLQYRRPEAEQMVQSALKQNPKLDSVEDLIALIFKQEQQGKAKVHSHA
jgi:Holliday junction DNA helicase RuvA